MADITMCSDCECLHRRQCRRSPVSGTPISEYRQAWLMWPKTGPADDPANCEGWWPVRESAPHEREAFDDSLDSMKETRT